MKRVFDKSDLVVGIKLACTTAARGGTPMPCEILELRKTINTLGEETTQYYVHYINCDKRLDEWVEKECFDLESIEDVSKYVAALNPLSPMGTENKFTRQQKRKHDELTVPQQSAEDLPASQHALEKEHEEATKIRNIERITLGQYEIDTWYFSPYPEELLQNITTNSNKLFICEFCLKPLASPQLISRHKAK